MSRLRNWRRKFLTFRELKKRKNLKNEQRLIRYSLTFLIFWFLALFPGRVGFDTKLAFSLMQSDHGTDWWTGWYWRILQLLTFNGSQIVLFVVIAYSLFWIATFQLINSYASSSVISSRMKLIASMLPIMPVFAMTVQHDVFFCTGILMLIRHENELQKMNIEKNAYFRALLFITPLLLTTKQGVILFPLLIFRMLFMMGFKKTILASSFFSLFFVATPSIGLDHTWSKQSIAIPFIMDIKCAVQHPESKISRESMIYLQTLLPYEVWFKPESCKEIDGNTWNKNINYQNFSFSKTLKVYFELLPDHAEIFLMAHIQRSTTVLPPPFFRGPDNQVDLNYANPIGQGTNLALQSAPPLLHPSVDDRSVDLQIKILRPLTYVAQAGIFLVNQASRYWGWGGLWFWAIMLHHIYQRREIPSHRFFKTYWYLIFLHFVLFTIGISATGRHVMPTICVGIITLSRVFLQIWSTEERLERTTYNNSKKE